MEESFRVIIPIIYMLYDRRLISSIGLQQHGLIHLYLGSFSLDDIFTVIYKLVDAVLFDILKV